MALPNDVLNEIMHHLDFKSFIQYCKANQQININCKHKLKEKLQQEINVPLSMYNDKQVQKITNMVVHGSFRQDIVLQNYIYYINDQGYLIDTINNKTYKNAFIKVIKSKNSMRGSQLLLLDKHGHIWSFLKEANYDNYDNPSITLKQITFEPKYIDISSHTSIRQVFFVGLTIEGDVYLAVKEDPLDSNTKYNYIGKVTGGVKVANGSNHVLVLDNKGDVYFFSHAFNYQVPLEGQYKDIIRFTKLKVSHVKQVVADQDNTYCLRADGTIIYFTNYKEMILNYNKKIIHMVTNDKMLLLLDNQGNLYKLSIYKLYTDKLDNYLVGTNVVNMQVGTDNDMIMVNQDGIYTFGGSNFLGSWSSIPNKIPLLFEKYNPL